MATLRIPVTKAGNKTIEIDTDTDLPEDMYRMALEEGLKVMLNKRMSKISTKGLEGEKLEAAHTAALAIAAENLETIRASKVKKGRAASATGTKISGVVMTEARRLAKEIVKNEIRAAGMKISHVEASEITKVANAYIEANPAIIEEATANIEARSAKVVALNVAGMIHVSPKLVAKAEKAKTERKSTLSAKQAGKVAPRKGSVSTQAAH